MLPQFIKSGFSSLHHSLILQRWLILVILLYDVVLCQRRVDPALIEEYCKNFTHGQPDLMQFYSPMYPREYPSEISCFRTITAEFGNFVRIDFRDVFRIEPPNNEGACEYDYLEIRDGDQGYAPLIGKKICNFVFQNIWRGFLPHTFLVCK